MIKNILYIGSKYEYNLAANGEALNKRAFHDNFVHMGYAVTAIWYEGEYPDLQQEIIETAARLRPDIVFFVLQREQVNAKTLRKLQTDGHFTVNWFGDDHWRFDSFTSRFAPLFSACITTHKFSIDRYIDIGQPSVIRSEWASIDSDVEFENVDYEYDVSFVGGANAYRKWFVKELGRRGIRVECFGDRWPNGRIDEGRMEHIFSHSRINLGLSNSTQFDARYLLSHPRNILNTIRNPKSGSHVKARNFEIPMRGGFQLTEYAPCLEEYFSIGEELVCYREIEDAEMLIRYYLRRSTEREEIKQAGTRRARQDHVFTRRIEGFLREIENMLEARRSNAPVNSYST